MDQQPVQQPTPNPEPTEPSPSSQPNPFDSQNKKSKKKLLITILVSIGAVLLIGGGVLGFFMLWPKDGADDTTQVDDTHNDQHDEDEMVNLAEPLMTKIREKVAADLKTEYPAYTDTLQEGSAPAYLVDGYDYRFSGEFGYTSSYMIPNTVTNPGGDMAFSAAVNEIARDLIKEEGLTLGDSNENTEEYKSDAIICTIELESVPAYVRCANIWSYEMNVAAAKPFADAYFAANTDIADKSLTVLRTPIIKDSVNEGYKTATVSIGGHMSVGGAAGLFYNADNKWNYFKSTQGLLICSDYDTEALKMAYEDQICYNNETNMDDVVKP